jgi:hypothetical protein
MSYGKLARERRTPYKCPYKFNLDQWNALHAMIPDFQTDSFVWTETIWISPISIESKSFDPLGFQSVRSKLFLLPFHSVSPAPLIKSWHSVMKPFPYRPTGAMQPRAFKVIPVVTISLI